MAGEVRTAEAGGLESAAAPSGAERFPCLDGLRALAAVTVVLTHVGFETGASLAGPLSTVLARFDVGVAVFFVLSGFLLHRPQAVAALSGRAQPAWRPYLWRRALRVLPAYWLAVVLALVLLPENRGAGLGTWLEQLSLTAIYVDAAGEPGLTQMWSLGTEVSFYVALPLLGRLAGRTVRSQLALCAGLLAVGLAFHVLVGREVLPPQAGFWLPTHLDWFAYGMALAVLVASRDRVLAEVAGDGGTCWLGAAALFAVAGTPLVGGYGLDLLTATESVARTLLYGAVAVLLVLPAVAGDQDRGAVRAVLRSRPAVFLGRVSYGVFLLHLVVLEVVLLALDLPPFGGRMPLVAALVLPVTVLLAWASLRLVEEPALRLRDRGPASTRG